MGCDNRIPLVCIVGPTASGKTSLAIEVAKMLDGEIVSADSMQIYKGMDIATAMPTQKEQQAVKHHLISFLDSKETFSVAQYCELAHKAIKDIYFRNKLPILVGGTGLYIDSVVNNITFANCESNEEIRTQLKEFYDNNGVEPLLDMLSKFDPESAKKFSLEKNIKRIIRAIEVYKTTGVTMTEHNRNSRCVDSPYNVIKIGLTANDRQYLYDRINSRVDLMIQSGLLDEAKTCLDCNFSCTACMAIGHKELLPYFQNKLDLSTCVENLKMQTRRYAKRQLTWFRKDENIHWFNIDLMSDKDIIFSVTDIIKKVLINEEKT